MFLITDIKNFYRHSKARQHLRARRENRLFSSLTWAILAFNTFALAVLAGSVYYVNRYQDVILEREMDMLQAQTQIYTDAIVESALAVDEAIPGKPQVYLDPIKAKTMILRFSENNRVHFKLVLPDGNVLADSHWWGYRKVTENSASSEQEKTSKKRKNDVINTLIEKALAGELVDNLLRLSRDEIHVHVARPVRYGPNVIGALVVGVSADYLEQVRRTMGIDILIVFFGTLALTVIISSYLSRILGYPLRNLAKAADRIRHEVGANIEVPDYTMRDDEIGDLSAAMREMTRVLQARLVAIEQFAADVSHELKNPLTSIRSAFETFPKVKDEEKRQKLRDIIEHDLWRMDRLISDISSVSRLDAQLTREHMDPVDIKELLKKNTHKQYEMVCRLCEEGRMKEIIDIRFIDASAGEETIVRGLPLRLNQVFDNLLMNALSFSPDGGAVTVTLMRDERFVIVTIDDEGPGIPEDRLDKIFERFYTDRPVDEQFGNSSGLGLSICHQIIEAHKAQIWAENRKDENDKILGARFIISFPAEHT